MWIRRRPLAHRWRLPSVAVLAFSLVLVALVALPAVASATSYVVSNTGDASSPTGCIGANECSLREAIERANENEGFDEIDFGVTGTIALGTKVLPPITDTVEIDGTSAPGYAGVPLVAIDGTNATSENATEGLAFLGGSGGSSVEGLAIGGFEYGVRIAGQGPSRICASYLGVGLDGTTAFPNQVGILTDGVGDEIGASCSANGGNLISGNGFYGILDVGNGTAIARNRIGVDATGAALPNGPSGGAGAGILVGSTAQHPSIGGLPGDGQEPGNLIADNEGAGILVENGDVGASIRANRIFGNSTAAIEFLANPPTPAPVIEFSSVEGTGTSTVFGNLHAGPNEDVEVDVFASPTCYPGGAGEARAYIGTIFTATDAGGEATFLYEELAEPPDGYEYFTATATPEETGATSAISQCQDQRPGVGLVSVPNSTTAADEATFEFIGLDANGSVAKFECSLDGGPFEECSSPQTYTGLTDGSHHFEAIAYDQVGTVSTPNGFSWNVDTTYPAAFFKRTPPSVTSQTSAEFEWEVTDFEGSGVKKVECSLDGGPLGPCNETVEYDALADGPHQFVVWVTDQVGHEAFNFYDWTVDTVPPEVEIESEPPFHSNSSEATIEFSGEDAGGSGIDRFECRLDGAEFAPCESPQNLSGLSEGSHTFQVKAFDGAGNVSDVASSSWEVDTVAPQITLESTPSDPTSQTFGTFEFSTADPGGSGVASVKCRFDGTVLTTCTSPDSISPLADGEHVFEVQAKDNAGNLASETFSWTVDSTPPTTSITSQPPNPSGSANASFEFTGADPGGSGVVGFECSLDGAEFAECASPKAYSDLSDGSHTFEVRAFDQAGNRDASPATYTWTVETATPAAPQLTGTTPASPANETSPLVEGSAPAGTTVTLYKTANCTGTPVTTTATPAQLAAGIEVTVTANAVTEFSAKATSPAAISSACSQPLAYREDSTAPTTSITSQPPNPSGSASASFEFTGADPGGSGVAKFECSLDGAQFDLCSSPKPYSALVDGSHTFDVRAVDNAGNTDASPAAYTWTVEATAPAAPQLTATDPASPAADPAPLLIGSAGAGTTVSIYETGDCTGTPQATAVTPAELEAGVEVDAALNAVTEFSAKATSPAAITSACSAPLAYREDSTAPSTAIDSSPTSSSSSGTAIFTFGGADPGGSGVGGFECSLDAAPFEPCTSPKEYSGLSNGPHSFEVRAVDDAGNPDSAPPRYSWNVESSSGSAQPLGTTAPPPGPEPTPSNGESVAVAPEGGKVLIQRPGQKKPTELREGETIPVGSIVDATKGKVLLTSVNAAGETQSAYFFGGKFVVQQHEGSGLVILKLRGELNCAGGAARHSTATASGAKSGRKLWGSGHGNFRTEGSSGSATVRGTIWLTEDRCDGSTFFRVRRGVVSVRDFTKEKTISVPAGNTYTAGP
jgi:hypothetical protein